MAFTSSQNRDLTAPEKTSRKILLRWAGRNVIHDSQSIMAGNHAFDNHSRCLDDEMLMVGCWRWDVGDGMLAMGCWRWDVDNGGT